MNAIVSSAQGTTESIASRQGGAAPTARPAYVIREGSIAEHRDAVSRLLELHWEEVAKNKGLMRLAPDWAKYQMLDDQHYLLILVAYAGEELVGYSCNLLDGHLHYSDLRYAQNDVLFLHKDHRASPLGQRLIKRTEEDAKQRGAKLMMWHAKEDSALSKIMQAKRRPIQDIIYACEL